MRKIILFFAVLLFMVPAVYAKGIYIVHEDAPNWVVEGMDSGGFWYTPDYAYSVGVAKNIRNHSLLRTTAENRARTKLLKGLHVIKTITKEVEIHSVWEDLDTHELYALARMPIKIIPAEK